MKTITKDAIRAMMEEELELYQKTEPRKTITRSEILKMMQEEHESLSEVRDPQEIYTGAEQALGQAHSDLQTIASFLKQSQSTTEEIDTIIQSLEQTMITMNDVVKPDLEAISGGEDEQQALPPSTFGESHKRPLKNEGDATGHDLSKQISSALEKLMDGDDEGVAAILYDVLENLESDDPQYNPTMGAGERQSRSGDPLGRDGSPMRETRKHPLKRDREKFSRNTEMVVGLQNTITSYLKEAGARLDGRHRDVIERMSTRLMHVANSPMINLAEGNEVSRMITKLEDIGTVTKEAARTTEDPETIERLERAEQLIQELWEEMHNLL